MDPNNDLSELSTTFEVRERLSCFVKAEYTIDDGFDAGCDDRAAKLDQAVSITYDDVPDRGTTCLELEEVDARIVGAEKAY